MVATVVRLPWNGQYWPGRMQDGVPTFPFRCAPPGLATRRQLRAEGLCPGGHEWVAQLRWRRGRRWAALYRRDTAAPSPSATPAQLAALRRAELALRTCRGCAREFDYRLPRCTDRRCFDCDQANDLTKEDPR